MKFIKGKPLSIILLASVCFNSSHAVERESLDSIVAIVNDDIVIESELNEETKSLQSKIAKSGSKPLSPLVIRKQALDRLILTKLQLSEADRLGISINDESLAKAITNIAKRNEVTVQELGRLLREQGMPMDVYREDLRQQIIISRLRNKEVVSKIKTSKAEVDGYLQRNNAQNSRSVRLAHILIRTPESASAEEIGNAKQKADRLLIDIVEGANFSEVARNESDGRKALEGGDLGWMEAGQVPSLFAAQVESMQLNDVVGPLQSNSGFHIIQLAEIRGEERHIVQQTHARHILVRTDDTTSSAEAQARLTDLLAKIDNGEDFATLARTHSDDNSSGIKGGDLGWVGAGDLVEKFEQKMNDLQINELSAPFETEFGWHIVQVLERRDHDATDETLRNEARAAIRDRKSDEALELYLRRLRDEACVEIRVADLK
jgi:peptidyl-prolyl cis-trans isomerase SurA